MAKVSVIIPARNEPFLGKTVADVFKNAVGEIEVIIVLDGVDCQLEERPNLVVIRKPVSEGMRPAINSASTIAKGKYLMKLDAHCMVGLGFDVILQRQCDVDWIVVPRRYALDPENWAIKPDRKYPIDYHYLSYPWSDPKAPGFHGVPWRERTQERIGIDGIDDEMSSQGSCWFMPTYYFQKLGLMQTVGYGLFAQEFQELGFKAWLSGGQVKVNKQTWYAHWHKGKAGRGYPLSRGEIERSARWSLDHWRRHPKLEWLIDKFWPVPGWPANWKEMGWAA